VHPWYVFTSTLSFVPAILHVEGGWCHSAIVSPGTQFGVGCCFSSSTES
jgi:hypothetical protein